MVQISYFSENIKRFLSMLKDIFNLKQKSLFTIPDPVGVKLLPRLRLRFSHLNEHKFCHNFKDVLSAMVLKLKRQTTFSCIVRVLQ